MLDLAAITALATPQHGAIALEQLADCGVTRRERHRALADGWLVAVGPGVYLLAGSQETFERSVHIGLRRLGPSAVVSHGGAARLHRFDGWSRHVAEFTVPPARRGARDGLVVHTSRTLGPHDVLRAGGVPCTSATRTIIDLARTGIPPSRLERAIDSAVRSGASSPIVLAARLREMRGPGHWGVRTIDEVLPDSGGHSALERDFLALVRRGGLPRPATQVVHRAGGRTFARVDFLFDVAGVVVEVSGRLGHTSDAERAQDARRRNELQLAGRQVLEFTTADVDERPTKVLATLRVALGVGKISA